VKLSLSINDAQLGVKKTTGPSRETMQRFGLGQSERVPFKHPFEPPWDAR
jgi:hypothetical protein